MAATVFRWDLDKTYLVSHFESLRQLIRIPFQKAEDKEAVPGVVPLIQSLRGRAVERGDRPSVFFLSASPPQIGGAIRDKLKLDGITYEGITFKDQVRHLMRARFDVVREQIGYKLEQLLVTALESEPGTRELLFGDDWESDPFIYSLYADIVAGKLTRERVVELLERAHVNKDFVARIADLVASVRPAIVVDGIFILRQRPAAPVDLAAFGRRLVWFDNYFECSLALYAAGWLSTDGVAAVAEEVGLGPEDLAASFDAVDERGRVDRAWLGAVANKLVGTGKMGRVSLGFAPRRAAGAVRRAMGRTPAPYAGPVTVPEYAELVERWSLRGRKEAAQAETATGEARDAADADEAADGSKGDRGLDDGGK